MTYVAPSNSVELVVDGFATGLVGTIGFRIRDNQGADVTARTTAGIAEDIAGSGVYRITVTAPSTPGQYTAVWDDAAGLFATEELTVTPSPYSLVDTPTPTVANAGELVWWVGNLDPSIGQTITVGGAPFDLTGATVRFRMRPVGSSTLKVDQPAQIESPVDGTVRYDWQAADMDTAGQFLVWWTVTLGGKTQDLAEAMLTIADHVPITHGYLEPEQWKTSLTMVGLTYADLDIEAAIEAASRCVDFATRRRFWPDDDATSVRYYSPTIETRVRIDDLLQLASVESSPGCDGVFETWTPDTDFRLGPYDAEEKGEPWTRIELITRGSYWHRRFPTWYPHSVRVTGRFGWLRPPANIVQATSIIATQLVRRVREAPFGVVGLGLEQEAVRISRDDPHVRMLLAPYTSRPTMGMA